MTDLIYASAAHAAAMAALHEAAFPPAERWTADALAQQLALPGTFALIEGAQGFVLARVAADEAEILTLAVLPAARRRGVAARLMHAAHRHAAAVGALAMLLEVAQTNHAARALYSRLGYQEVGRRKRYYPDGGDALVLRAELRAGAAAS